MDTSEDLPGALPFLPSTIAKEEEQGREAYVVVIDNVPDFLWWIQNPEPKVQWLEVQDLIGVAEIWRNAAGKETDVAIDLIIEKPEKEAAYLSRLVEVSNVRDIRVSIKTRPGFLKALKMATSLGLPVRLLPVHMGKAGFKELAHALDYYLNDPEIRSPVEFFRSALLSEEGPATAHLWQVIEDDSTVFERWDSVVPPSDAAERYVKYLKRPDPECRKCRHLDFCRGFFKQWDPNDSCKGILKVYDKITESSQNVDKSDSRFTVAPSVIGKNPLS